MLGLESFIVRFWSLGWHLILFYQPTHKHTHTHTPTHTHTHTPPYIHSVLHTYIRPHISSPAPKPTHIRHDHLSTSSFSFSMKSIHYTSYHQVVECRVDLASNMKERWELHWKQWLDDQNDSKLMAKVMTSLETEWRLWKTFLPLSEQTNKAQCNGGQCHRSLDWSGLNST